MELQKIRNSLDVIDKQMAELFEKRMDLCAQVARIKAESGKAVYDGDTLRTVNVETIRYKATPTRYTEPQKRPVNERKPPNRKKP